MTRMYKATVIIGVEIHVEAESDEEAERIIDGVIDSRPHVLIVEASGDDENPDDYIDRLHASPQQVTALERGVIERFAK